MLKSSPEVLNYILMGINQMGDGPDEDAIADEEQAPSQKYLGRGHSGFKEDSPITCVDDVIKEFGRLTERSKFYYHQSRDLFMFIQDDDPENPIPINRAIGIQHGMLHFKHGKFIRLETWDEYTHMSIHQNA